MDKFIHKGVDLKKKGSYYLLDYGEVPVNSKRKREVLYQTDEEVKSLDTGVSCSACTSVSYAKISDGTFNIVIDYDTSLLGSLNKNVYIYPKDDKGKVLRKLKINFTGKTYKA